MRNDKNNPGPPPRDELDALLRSWHDTNAERAAAGRDELLAAIRESAQERVQGKQEATRPAFGERVNQVIAFVGSLLMHRYSPAVASLIVLVAIVAVFVPGPTGGGAYADQILVPDGGRLDALDEHGAVIGPCPLQHTDVDVQISGFFSRVTLTQHYANPYERKIEAVYTFPLSHRAAVDRMTMTVGDRVVQGEVKERSEARRIYEAARERGYVASLLEQQRPNIFTQSVANIEPGATVLVEISYVEILERKDDRYAFDFPMVVGPRYMPGAPTASRSIVPAELTPRQGVILLGPAQLTVGAAGDATTLGTLQRGKLEALLLSAQPIAYPGDAWWGRGDATGGAGQAQLWHRFEATYGDGAKEFGELYTDGTGRINGRWFYADPKTIAGMGTGFAQNTSQVPDASLISPQPVRPTERAGHDISVTVTIDTGGPGILDVKSELHAVTQRAQARREDGHPRVMTIALEDQEAIPNKDFVLSWGQTADAIEEATFVHRNDQLGDFSGGFFTLILQPPDRVDAADVPPRELVFVMDTSGSMRGHPLEKSKAVMSRALEAMRPHDTFNVVTFSGHTSVLWESPRPATPDNREAARGFIQTRRGGGGTEMMKAIDAALVQGPANQPAVLTAAELANLPADGRTVTVRFGAHEIIAWPPPNVRSSWAGMAIQLGDAPPVQITGSALAQLQMEGGPIEAVGRWVTRQQRRVFEVDRWSFQGAKALAPMRIAMFFTDGYVGNDMAIVDAIRKNAGTTRVFSFGIGNSVNRYLLDTMAQAGRGESEFVLLSSDADAAVDRFAKRIQTPVLLDIELEFSEGLQVIDLLPAPGAIPDLWDVQPLVIHGRYGTPGRGQLTIRGRTGAGPWSRSIDLDLPANAPEHDVAATLWARAKVDQVMEPHLAAVQQGQAPQPVKQQIVALGEQFSLMTQFTSFVAVEKSRMTVDGKPVLVAVPIEMPDGVSWEGIFGADPASDSDLVTLGAPLRQLGQEGFQVHWQQGRELELKMDDGLVTSSPDARSTSVLKSASAFDSSAVDSFAAVDRNEQLRRNRLARSAPSSAPPPAAGKQWYRAGGKRDAPGKGAGGAGFAAGGGGPADAERGLRALSAKLPPPAPTMGRVAGEPTVQSATAPGADEITDFRGDTLAIIEMLEESDADDGLHDLSALWYDPNFVVNCSFGQEVILLIDEQVEGDRLAEAKQLADQLAGAQPKYEAGITVHNALGDETLSETERRAIVAEQAEIAKEQLERAKAVREHQERLVRVLDRALLLMLYPPQLDEVEAPKDAPREQSDGRILVTVLVTNVDAKMRSAVEQAGLVIESASKSLPIIVGRVRAGDLEKLAMIDGVRRIEPARLTPSG